MKAQPHNYRCRCTRCRVSLMLWRGRNWWIAKVWQRFRFVFTLPGHRGKLAILLEWKLADVWIGMFWRVTRSRYHNDDHIETVDVWVCLLPCLPVHFHWADCADCCGDPDEVPF